MSDAETLAVYAAQAQAYRDRFAGAPSRSLIAFAELLPKGATVLDLGCGPGNAAVHMAAQGHQVDAWDASPAFIDAIDAPGVTPRLATFEALDAVEAYDGIWANFSLLHATRAAFPGHMDRIAGALRPGGVLFLGMKTGTGERRDHLGRFYAFHSVEELRAAFTERGIGVLHAQTGEEAGLAGTVDPFLLLTGRKDG
ncbi:MAG: class I SAM-dependent methyltransferase [Shimia sp.]